MVEAEHKQSNNLKVHKKKKQYQMIYNIERFV